MHPFLSANSANLFYYRRTDRGWKNKTLLRFSYTCMTKWNVRHTFITRSVYKYSVLSCFFCLCFHLKVRNVFLEWIYGVLAWNNAWETNISALDWISQFFSTQYTYNNSTHVWRPPRHSALKLESTKTNHCAALCWCKVVRPGTETGEMKLNNYHTLIHIVRLLMFTWNLIKHKKIKV